MISKRNTPASVQVGAFSAVFLGFNDAETSERSSHTYIGIKDFSYEEGFYTFSALFIAVDNTISHHVPISTLSEKQNNESMLGYLDRLEISLSNCQRVFVSFSCNEVEIVNLIGRFTYQNETILKQERFIFPKVPVINDKNVKTGEVIALKPKPNV